MSRPILSDGLILSETTDYGRPKKKGSMWVLGPSTEPADPFANETIVEVEIESVRFAVPLGAVFKMIDAALQKQSRQR